MNSYFKRFYIAAFVLMITGSIPHSLLAQNESDLELFEGGNIRSGIGIRSHLLTGAGVRGAYNGVIAPFNTDPFVIFGNPAALGQIDGRKVVISSAPDIELDLESLSDPNPTLQTEVDKRLESFNRKGSVTYPKMTGTFGRLGSLVSGFAVALPIEGNEDDRWLGGRIPRLFDYVAFGYTEPFTMNINYTYSGLRTRLRTVDKDDAGHRVPENEIMFYASIKMDADVTLSSDAWNISVARNFGDFWYGAGLQRTAGRIEVHASQRTDGIMSKAGNESSFNDPQSPWDDDYFFGAHGIFEGSALALRLGTTYQPTDKLLFGAMIRLQGDMKMDADFGMELHTFRALKLTAAEGEKQFDVNEIKDASELTRTTAKIFETASSMDVSIPSELAVSASYNGFLKPSLTFTKYFGEFSFQYDVIEDGALFNYRRGYKPDMGLNLNFDAYLLKFCVGAVSVVDVVDGYHDVRGNPIPPASSILIPRLSFGFETGLSDQLRLAVLLYGLPEDFLRLTLEYTL